MPIIKIEVAIAIDPGTCTLLTVTPIPVPQQALPVLIVWTINGATFDPSGGITMTGTIPPGSMPLGPPSSVDNVSWQATVLNNGSAMNGTLNYTVNYICNGLPFSQDPTIENQPPGG